MKFTQQDDDGTRIEVEIPNHANLSEVASAFAAFLKACGYSTDDLADYFE